MGGAVIVCVRQVVHIPWEEGRAQRGHVPSSHLNQEKERCGRSTLHFRMLPRRAKRCRQRVHRPLSHHPRSNIQTIHPHPHHYATLNSGISPISCFNSPPTLYATLHLSLIASTFFVLSPECHTLIDCVTPRLCLGASDLPDCGFSSSS